MEKVVTQKINEEEQVEVNMNNITVKKIRSLEEILGEIGLGFFQYRLLLMCGLAFMADSMEISLLGYLSTCAGITFNLDNSKKASISGVVFGGQLIGTLMWGKIGDHYGRRTAFLLSSTIISLFGFLSGISPNYESLLIFRMLVGVGIGGSIISFDVIAEFLPLSHRGQFLIAIEYFWTIGSMLVAGLAWFILSKTSWRILAIVTAIPVTLSLLFATYCLPESVRWLISRKKMEQAENVLVSIAKLNGISLDPFKLSYELEFGSTPIAEESSWIDLISTKYMRRRTFPLWIVWPAFAFSYNGIVLYINRIYSSSPSSTTTSLSCSFSYKNIFINSTSEILGLILTNFLIDFIGRTKVMTMLYFLASIIFIIIGSIGFSEKTLLFACLFFGRMFLMGSSSTTWVITSELYPTRLRTTGHSVCNSIARMFAFLCPYLVYSQLSDVTVSVCFAILAGIAAIASFNLPETNTKKLDADDNDYFRTSIDTVNSPLLNDETLN